MRAASSPGCESAVEPSYPHGAVAALEPRATTARRDGVGGGWHNLRVQFKKRSGGGVMGCGCRCNLIDVQEGLGWGDVVDLERRKVSAAPIWAVRRQGRQEQRNNT